MNNTSRRAHLLLFRISHFEKLVYPTPYALIRIIIYQTLNPPLRAGTMHLPTFYIHGCLPDLE